MNKRLIRNRAKQNPLNNNKKEKKKENSTMEYTGVQLSWQGMPEMARPGTVRTLKKPCSRRYQPKDTTVIVSGGRYHNSRQEWK